MAKKQSKEIKKITANTFSRGLSLLNVTVSSGARYASLKFGDLFQDKEAQKDNLNDFLKTQASKLVHELGKLKGSAMKAGQMLSIYGEHFLPHEVNDILKQLQADSRPVAWEEMHKALMKQLGPEKLGLLEIEPSPIAAASMGQVYRATIKATGEQLALKVQYPGVDKAIDSDLRAMKKILLMSKLIRFQDGFEEIFKEVRMMLHHEVDYQREAEVIEDYRKLLKDDSRFIIPTVFSEFSTKRVLAMSYEVGAKIDSEQILSLSQDRRNKLGAAFMELMFREIFQWRCVQTDPHFGNYLIRTSENSGSPQDKIVLLDFGAVRKFPKKYIEPFANLVYGALQMDSTICEEYGYKLTFLRDQDGEAALSLFSRICFAAIEGFKEEFESPSLDGSDSGLNPYNWGDNDLIDRLAVLGKDAVFTFKLRPPPREAIFLDRKMVGTYTLIAKLGLEYGPRKLILHYVTPHIKEAQDELGTEDSEQSRTVRQKKPI